MADQFHTHTLSLFHHTGTVRGANSALPTGMFPWAGRDEDNLTVQCCMVLCKGRPVLALCCHVRIILAQNQISMRDLPRRIVGYILVSAVGERSKVSTLKVPRALKRCGIRVPPPLSTIVRVYSSCLNSIYLPSFLLLFSLSPLLLLSSSSSTFQTSPPVHYRTLRHSIAFPVLAIVYLTLLFPSLR